MLQDILDEPAWVHLLTPADRRGLTPLFWMHVLPYVEVNLDMTSRLRLGVTAAAATTDDVDASQGSVSVAGVPGYSLP